MSLFGERSRIMSGFLSAFLVVPYYFLYFSLHKRICYDALTLTNERSSHRFEAQLREVVKRISGEARGRARGGSPAMVEAPAMTMALELRPNCEYCGKDLPPESSDAAEQNCGCGE